MSKQKNTASLMTKTKNSPDPTQEIPDPTQKINEIAERYLDLWQDNIQRWASDPDSLEKWLIEATRQKSGL